MISATNSIVSNDSGISLTMMDPGVHKYVENNAQVKAQPHYIFNPHVIIGIELSLVPQVDSVFVNREEDARTFRVTTVLNYSDAQIREQVYDRELEIIDQLPHVDFEFRVFDLRGRKVSEIMTDGGKLVFKRR